jgi:phenylpyruvate tautomerase PptA (4-oxalocrotonate tautomerase family)
MRCRLSPTADVPSHTSGAAMCQFLTCKPINGIDLSDLREIRDTVMPSTRITTGTWVTGTEAGVINAVQTALLSALKIPDYDRDVVLDVYDTATRIVPTGRSERYTRVEVTMFSGRSLDAKRALYRAVVENLSALGVPPNEIKIVLIEVPPENWGLRGGLPASEIDLGVEVNV